MTTPFLKTAWARTLPSLLLAFDFLAVLTISIIVLWLAVVVPVAALAQETPSGAPTSASQIIHGPPSTSTATANTAAPPKACAM